MGMWMLLALAILKIVATGLTISSGGSGGVFGPSMLIGGMLGGACGQFLAYWLPGAHDRARPRSCWSAWGAFSPVSPRRR